MESEFINETVNIYIKFLEFSGDKYLLDVFRNILNKQLSQESVLINMRYLANDVFTVKLH